MGKMELICILVGICISVSIAVTQNSTADDPSKPNQADMDLISQWKKQQEDDRNQKIDTETRGNTATSTGAAVAGGKVHQTESGECKCVKYTTCNISDNSTSAQQPKNDTWIVDARSIELKNDNATTNTNATNEDTSSSDCPHYFDYCCPLKDLKDNSTSTTEPPPPSASNSSDGSVSCGHRNENGIEVKLTGATQGEAQFAEFPWTAAIIQLDANDQGVVVNKYVGGGSLIHPKVILTAAHNVVGLNRSTLRVRLGEWDTQTNDEPYPSQDRNVAKVIIHDRFYRPRLYNDIALLILEEEATLAPNVQPVCLPPLGKNLKFDNQNCFSSGWGMNTFGAEGRYSEIMKKIQVPIVPKDTCQADLKKSDKLPNFEMDNSYICAGGTSSGEDTCKGDGGAPLVCSLTVKGEVHYIQVGAVSWGIGCGSTIFPAVYTNIQYLSKWIFDQMDKEKLSKKYFSLPDATN